KCVNIPVIRGVGRKFVLSTLQLDSRTGLLPHGCWSSKFTADSAHVLFITLVGRPGGPLWRKTSPDYWPTHSCSRFRTFCSARYRRKLLDDLFPGSGCFRHWY